MSYSPIIVPKTAEITVSRQTGLGIDNYDLDDIYSPDTDLWKSVVLDLGSPKYPPRVAAAPTRYWFDRSRYRNNGTIIGAIWKQLPSGVWVMQFDGTDDVVTIASNAVLAPGTSDFSILVWTKVDSTGTGYDYLYTQIGTNQNFALWIANITNLFELWTRWDASNTTLKTLGAVNYRDNTWHLFGGVWDRDGNLTGYVDGVAIDTGDISAFSAINLNAYTTVTIGDAANLLKGIVGKVLYCKRTLSLAEIQHIYQAKKWRYQYA